VDPAYFADRLHGEGWLLVASAVPADLLERLRLDSEQAYAVCREQQVRSGIAADTPGTLHHVVGLGNSFFEFLEWLPFIEHIEQYFGGRCVLHSFGGTFNLPGASSYVNNVHRDLRPHSPDLPLMLNMLVMLDEFTIENGATRVMPGSHRIAERPSDEEFGAGSVSVTGPVGSILFFNSNLWHSAGINRTGTRRRALTPTFCRPFMKPLFDYPRSLGYERMDGFSERLRQLLGYYSRVPASLDEWYRPPETRFFRRDQV
jgi:hypothetical protein